MPRCGRTRNVYPENDRREDPSPDVLATNAPVWMVRMHRIFRAARVLVAVGPHVDVGIW